MSSYDDDLYDDEDSGQRRRSESKLTEVIKKVASIGIGAAFMTEDAIRGILQDLPLPKDLVQGLVDHAKQQKDEVLEIVKKEVKENLSKVDPKAELHRILQNYEMDIQAKVKFTKKDDLD